MHDIMKNMFSKQSKNIKHERLEFRKINFEYLIVSSIGEFGRCQFVIVLASKLVLFFIAWSMIMMSFAGADPGWWIEEEMTSEVGNETIINYLHRDKSCPIYGNQTVKFKEDKFTIVSEWNLICDKEWISSAISTAQMIGVMIGAGIGGQLGEWLGRKKVTIIFLCMHIVLMVTLAFSVNWMMMMVSLFLVGLLSGGIIVIISCFSLEYVSTKWRTVTGIIPGWGLGVMMFGVMFKILPNWRYLCIATGILEIPVLVLMLFVPESIRWLLTQNKYEEGKMILEKMARKNGRKEPDLSLFDNALYNEIEMSRSTRKYTYWDIIRLESARWKVAIFSFMWFFNGYEYYALTLGVSKLSGDTTVNMVIMGLGEMSSMLILWLLAKVCGRKYSTMILWTLNGLSSFAITLSFFIVPHANFSIYLTIFALMARFFLSACFQSTMLFTVETFPTVVRTLSYGFVSAWGRFGGVLGTQNRFFSNIAIHLPFTINGFLAIGCVFVCIFLKDTYHSPMDDYLEEESDPSTDFLVNEERESSSVN